jgi:hypothetical protein
MSLTKFVGLLAGSTLTLTGVSYGAVEANNDTAAQINELKAEIAALKAQQGEQWLTEQRADAIRGVVQDVLADSSTRSSFQQAGATAGYNNGFFLSSADGNYTLKINALEQVRFVWNNTYQNTVSGGGATPGNDANQWGFENRRTQAFFSGNVVDPSWKYLVGMAYDSQLDPYYNNGNANTFQLYYANVTKSFGNGFSVTVGQQNVPWTVESQLFNAGSTQMGDYSIFEYVFGAGQQVGAMAAIEQDMWRVKGGWFNAVQTAANGASAPINAWNSENNQSVALAARAEFKVAGTWEQFSKESSFKGEEFGLLVGGGVIWQNGRAQNNLNTYDVNPIGITADARANFGGFNAIGQFLWQEGYPGVGSSESAFGINLQGGAFLTDDLELFGAWCYADTTSTQNFLQIGSNWYFAKNNLKMTIAGIIPLNNDAATNPSLRGFDAGVGLSNGPTGGVAGDADNNFTLIAQLQVMF